jgi:hypothetical protein
MEMPFCGQPERLAVGVSRKKISRKEGKMCCKMVGMENPRKRHRVIRPSRAVERVTEPPICVTKQGAIQIIGSPTLLADLETDRLVVPLTDGPRKWYSIINLKRAVLEKVRQRQGAITLASRKGHILMPIPEFMLQGVDMLSWRLRLALGMT